MRTDLRTERGNRSNIDVSLGEQLPRAIAFQTILRLEKAVRDRCNGAWHSTRANERAHTFPGRPGLRINNLNGVIRRPLFDARLFVVGLTGAEIGWLELTVHYHKCRYIP